jgi:hypothetical protein
MSAGDRGTADRVEADQGQYWIRLVTRSALDREGLAMQHCVGDGGYDSLAGGEDMVDDSIWSLRRADGESVLTVRVQDCKLDYARGFSNRPPKKGACLQVRHLVAAFVAAGRQLAVDESTGIVLLRDGQTFRRDRLPLELATSLEQIERTRPVDAVLSLNRVFNNIICGIEAEGTIQLKFQDGRPALNVTVIDIRGADNLIVPATRWSLHSQSGLLTTLDGYLCLDIYFWAGNYY